MPNQDADIGVIGLAVMGENLILNIESRGFRVAVHNRTTAKIESFLSTRGKGKNLVGAESIEAFCMQLKRPRKVLLMVKAGAPVDALIETLLPYLDSGDIIIDGGNSYFKDTIERTERLNQKGILFVGAGISGGEIGALTGPSIMPGGNPLAWPEIRPIFQAIAARVPDGTPCCEWVGNDGAGHFVKMVHNGIEYSDMQLIGEAYHLMSAGMKISNLEMHEIFQTWNAGELNSYLIEITSDILVHKDDHTGKPMIDMILDAAGQKGTGKWTAIAGLDLGVPIPQIAEAVFARCISAMKEERVSASQILKGPDNTSTGCPQVSVDDVRDALFAAKICAYAQGFHLMAAATEEYNWDLNFGDVALMWREGCIIRAAFLEKINEAYGNAPALANLLLDPYFRTRMDAAQAGWRRVVRAGIEIGVPLPSISTALHYYDSYRSADLPANMIQAQRDYFGAHTYERVDRPRGEFFHTDWTGQGGDTSASTYSA